MFWRVLTYFVMDTSMLTVVELLVFSVCLHKKGQIGQTYDEIRAKFSLSFDKPASSESNLSKLEVISLLK